MRNRLNTTILSGLFARGALLFFVLASSSCLSPQPGELSTTVESNPAVRGLSYRLTTLNLTKRVPIESLEPKFEEGTPRNYSIAPRLPAGLTFDVKTGILGGLPTQAIPPTPYTIHANNPKGFTSTTLLIEVMTTDPTASTVESPSDPLVANGEDTALISVTLLDRFMNPITRERVGATSSRGSIDEISPAIAITDSLGRAQFRVKSTRAGDPVLIVRDLNDRVDLATRPVISFVPGPATRLAFTQKPLSVVAGEEFPLEITAYDAFDNVATGHSAQVLLDLGDSNAPAQTVEAPFDRGKVLYPAAKLATAGVRSVTASDGTLTAGPVSITVLPGIAQTLVFTKAPPSEITALEVFPEAPAVTAVDAFGNRAIGFSDDITLDAYSDAACSVPVAGAFHANANPRPATEGQSEFTGAQVSKTTVIRIGAHAADPIPVLCSNPITVKPGPPSALKSFLQAQGPVTANGVDSLAIRIGIFDVSENPIPGVTPAFVATDTESKNQIDACTSTNDTGISNCALRSTKAEQKVISLTSPLELPDVSVLFKNGPAASLAITGARETRVAGTSDTLTIEVLDASQNRVTDFLGSIEISSNDARATFPGPLTLSGTHAGIVTAPNAVLRTAGEFKITAAVQSDPAVQGEVTGLQVTPAEFSPAHSLLASSASSLTADESLTLTLTARDAFENTSPTGISGTGAIALFSTLVGGTGTFEAVSDQGAGVFTAVFQPVKAGNTELSGTLGGGALSNTVRVTILPGAVTHFSFSGIPSPWVAGNEQEISITAKDAEENTVSSYTESVSFASSDAQATLPGATTLQDGTTRVPILLRTAGSRTLTVTDGTLSSTTSPITVIPGAAQSLVLDSVPASVIAGESWAFGVTAKDASGNTVPNHTRTVSVSSSDSSAVLPASQTLTDGTNSFSMTYKTAGSRTLTASDGSLSVTSSATTVAPAAYAIGQSELKAASSTLTAGSTTTITLTLKDQFGNTSPSGAPAATEVAITASSGSITNLRSTGTGAYAATFTAQTVGTAVIEARVSSELVPMTASVNVIPGAASSLALSLIPATAAAGSAFQFGITAKDTAGNTATGYSGTISLSSNDTNAVLPGSVTLSQGTGVFSATLKTAGSRTLSATDGTRSVSSPGITVNPATYSTAMSVLGVSASTVTSGASLTVTLTLRDAFGNENPSNTVSAQSIAFSASMVGGSGSFGAVSTNGSGVYQADFTGIRSGTVTVGAQVSGASIASQASVTVNPGNATSLTLAGAPASAISGSAFAITITALDSNQNIATGYSGSVSISSSDSEAVLPASGALLQGTKQFWVTLKTAGSRTLSASDGTLSTGATAVTVSAGAVASLVLGSVPETATAGTPVTVSVTAKDAAGNTASGYTGTVSFSSNDPQAVLPASGPLLNGQGTVSITFRTTGARTFTASDGTRSIPSSTITVTAGPYSLSQSQISTSAASVSSGSSLTLTLTLRDAYGNSNPSGVPAAQEILFHASSGAGTGEISSATAQGNGAFTASFTGVRSGSVTLRASSEGALISSQTQVTVNPGPASQLVWSSVPGTVTAGSSFNGSLSARDASGNLVPSYTGTIAFSSSDSAATLPQDSTLEDGSKQFSFTLRTAGSRTITASDGTLSATRGVTVDASGAVKLVLTALPSEVIAGDNTNFTVTARDAQDNIASGYTGTVSFTSSDSEAVLPAQSLLILGVGQFTVSLRTAGARTLTAEDGTFSSTSNVTVKPGAYFGAQSVLTSASESVSAGSPVLLTLTLKDRFGNLNPTGVPAGSALEFLASTTAGTGTFGAVSGPVNGVAQVSFTGTTAGSTSVSVRTGGSAFGNTIDLTVNPGPIARLDLSPSSATATAGESVLFTITAFDAYQNQSRSSASVTLESTSGTFSQTSSFSDGTVGIPANLTASGSFTMRARSGGVTSPDASLTVNPDVPAQAQSFVSVASNTVTSGESVLVSITIRDRYGNAVPTGTVSASDLELQTSLVGGSGTFGAISETGTGVFSASFTGVRKGIAAISATLSGTALGTGATIEVGAAPADHLGITGVPARSTAGAVIRLSVEALDRNNNRVTSYSGTIQFETDDSRAEVPASSTLVSGLKSFDLTLKTAGTKTLTIRDGTLPDSTFSIGVDPGALSVITLSGAPASILPEVSFPLSVIVYDGFQNALDSATNSIEIQSTDATATLPSSPVLSAGSASLPITFRAEGSFVVQVTIAGVTASTSSITVDVPDPTIAASKALVQVMGPGNLRCTGVLLRVEGILLVATAAHCTGEGGASTLSVLHPDFGETPALSITRHPSYNAATGAWDVALMSISPQATANLNAIAYPSEKSTLRADETATLFGFAEGTAYTEITKLLPAVLLGTGARDSGLFSAFDAQTQLTGASRNAVNFGGAVLLQENSSFGTGFGVAGLASRTVPGKMLLLDLSSAPVVSWIENRARALSGEGLIPIVAVDSPAGLCAGAVVGAGDGRNFVVTTRDCVSGVNAADIRIRYNGIQTDGLVASPTIGIERTPASVTLHPDGDPIAVLVTGERNSNAFDLRLLTAPVDSSSEPLDFSSEGVMKSIGIRAVAGSDPRAYSGAVLGSQIQSFAAASGLWSPLFDPARMIGVSNPSPGCGTRQAVLFVDRSASNSAPRLLGMKFAESQGCTLDSNDLYFRFDSYSSFLSQF